MKHSIFSTLRQRYLTGWINDAPIWGYVDDAVMYDSREDAETHRKDYHVFGKTVPVYEGERDERSS